MLLLNQLKSDFLKIVFFPFKMFFHCLGLVQMKCVKISSFIGFLLDKHGWEYSKETFRPQTSTLKSLKHVIKLLSDIQLNTVLPFPRHVPPPSQKKKNWSVWSDRMNNRKYTIFQPLNQSPALIDRLSLWVLPCSPGPVLSLIEGSHSS